MMKMCTGYVAVVAVVGMYAGLGTAFLTAAEMPKTGHKLIRMAVLPDQTLSSGPMQTPQVTLEQVLRLLNAVKGGPNTVEVGLALIRAESLSGLVRVRLAPAPVNPFEPTTKPSNPFAALQWQQKIATQQAQFRQQFDNWEAKTGADIVDFKRRIGPLLAQGMDAPRTDVNTPVRRALAFLNEPAADVASENAIVKMLIACSDGEDNVRAPFRNIPQGVRVIVVNGLASTGVFAAYHPIVFESFDSAIRYITADLER